LPRKPREKSETGIYHVMVRGTGQQDIFHKASDYLKYLELIQTISSESHVSILGYCLMTNHVHILVREDSSNLSAFMKRLGVTYAGWYNRKYDKVGHVFQDRFKSECVEDDAYLLTVIRYIHHNPVKALVVSRPEKYQWSSCADYFKNQRKDEDFPDTRLILGIMHADQAEAVKRFQKYTEEERQDQCLDCDLTRRIGESEALEIVRQTLGGKPISALTAMHQDEICKISRILRCR